MQPYPFLLAALRAVATPPGGNTLALLVARLVALLVQVAALDLPPVSREAAELLADLPAWARELPPVHLPRMPLDALAREVRAVVVMVGAEARGQPWWLSLTWATAVLLVDLDEAVTVAREAA